MMKPELTDTDLLKRYKRYLKLQRNCSAHTLDAYVHDLELLMGFAALRGLTLLQIRLSDLHAFASTLHEQGIGARSQARVLSGIRSFYKYLLAEDYIDDDPTHLLESPHIGRRLPEVLETEEIDQILASIDLSKWEGQRNKAIIEVLFSCGLRVSELVGLRISDIFADEKFIRIIGKGDKERLVPISEVALEQLRYWFMDRNLMRIKSGEEDFVFLNRRGSRLTRTMILIMVKQYAAQAGITKNISPHTFRHSFATALLQGGADLRFIQALLGHEDIGTTEIYTHIDTHKLQQEILEHHPRNIKYALNKQKV